MAKDDRYDAMPGAHWIIDSFMCVGNFASAGVTGTTKQREAKRLRMLEQGITHVVNCTHEFDCPFRNDFSYLHLFAADVYGQNMIAYWPTSCSFIAEARAQGGKVLVHCAGGHSRSASVALAYLMKSENLSFADAFSMAQKRRPSLAPNAGFREQLELFHRLKYSCPDNGEFRKMGKMEILPQLQATSADHMVSDLTCTSAGSVEVRERGEASSSERSQPASSDKEFPICIQFCSDMHLELPLETKRFGQHLRECLELSTSKHDGSVEASCVSDIEFENGLLPVRKGAYLALLGDVFDGAKIREGTYKAYLMKQCVGFEAVFVLAGNHEFYRSEYNSCRSALRKMCEEVTVAMNGSGAVHFLDCDRVDLPSTQVRVLGCTLWSAVSEDDADAVAKALTDYTAISVCDADESTSRKVKVEDTNAWHARELAWLQNEIAEAERDGVRCVVMTHHAPSFHGTCAPAHEGSSISSGFCSNLERLLRPPVCAWLFGHTHWSSCQRYRPDLSANGEGSWTSIAEVHSTRDSRMCDSAHMGDVLVASNQVGYGAKGEHRRSRCHPFMALSLATDGGQLACRYERDTF
eukprot:TRINITY_DN29332_c0_g2_i1.p1 TRINITY_DN29332_c0_g2~~TRINITY_DN29332_c0_g2_i1.p1  ORF type:complete len:648 (-),score=60.11 TRINITY_DN29332_c0_g2_i1:183-1922(-)